MTSVNITVADPGDLNGVWRWAVNRDGQEVDFGLALDEEAAYAAAKPLFDRLRAEMAEHARRRSAASE